MCSRFCHQNVELLQYILLTNFPDYPWQRVAANFFTWKDNYLILVDFYFHYIKMSNKKMKFYNFIFSDTTRTLNQFWQGTEYQKLLFLTMTPNFHQWLLPSLLWVMAFTTTLVVPITPKVTRKQIVWCKQLYLYCHRSIPRITILLGCSTCQWLSQQNYS